MEMSWLALVLQRATEKNSGVSARKLPNNRQLSNQTAPLFAQRILIENKLILK